MIRRLQCEGSEQGVDVRVETADDGWEVTVDGRVYGVSVARDPQGVLHMRINDKETHRVHTHPSAADHLIVDGCAYWIADVTARRSRRASRDTGGLVAPMPGTVLEVRVAAGDSVTQGQVLVVVEAMKMEHAIKSPKDGIVSRLDLTEGQRVGAGETLVEIE